MITLICGLPNAGKTTYSQRFSPCIHLDDCDEPRLSTFAAAVAAVDGDVWAEGVCNSAKSRKGFLRRLRHRPDRKVCVWLDTPLEVCLEREEGYRRRPADMVYRHAQMFEPPTLEEGWDEIIIVRP